MSRPVLKATAQALNLTVDQLLAKAREHKSEMNRKARKYGLGDCYSMEDAIASIASQS